jgi:hypothetical protein
MSAVGRDFRSHTHGCILGRHRVQYFNFCAKSMFKIRGMNVCSEIEIAYGVPWGRGLRNAHLISEMELSKKGS